MTIRSVHVSSLLSRLFLGEQSLAKWSLLTTLTWHWHGDIFNHKSSRNPLFGVFVYATAAPLYSPIGCPPFLIISEKLCEKCLLTSYDCLVLVVFLQPNVVENDLTNWKGVHRLKIGRFTHFSANWSTVGPWTKCIFYIIRQIISSYIIHGTITFYTIQPVLADWPFVRQWIEWLCGIVSVGLDSAVAELSSPQVNRVSQQWIESCVLRNWI